MRIIPLFTKVRACFYDASMPGKVFKSPVLFITQENDDADYKFVDGDRDGFMFEVETGGNLLGYEYEDENYDWSEKIKEYEENTALDNR